MSCILTSHMFLQILLYNTMIDAAVEQTEDNKLDTHNNSFGKLKSKLKEKTDQYRHCETIYGELVAKSNNEIKIKKYIKIGQRIEREYYTITADNIINLVDHYKKNNDYHKFYKLNHDEQKFFLYIANLLLDSYKFVALTIRERSYIKNIYYSIMLEDMNEEKLMKKQILSCNWIHKLVDKTNYCIIDHMFDLIMIKYDHNSMNFQICENYNPLENKDVVNKHITLMHQYFIKKKFSTLDEMNAIVYLNYTYMWMVENNIYEDLEIDQKIVDYLLTHIKLEMSMQTKITKLVKTGYYNDFDEKTKNIETSEEHKEIIKRLKLEDILPDFYKLNINAYCMYKDETIEATTNIIELINSKINDLLQNSKIITEQLFNIIKKKICKRVNSHMVSLGPVIAKSLCKKIKKIKNPTIEDITDKTKQITTENIIDVFFGEIMKIINKAEEPTIICEKVNSIKKKLESNIFLKYTKIIETVKELNNIEENKKMPEKLRGDILSIKEYTKKIGHKYVDREDIYLGLDTPTIDKNNGDSDDQNKRKLCEMRVIEIMEKVITYKGMIMKTENCMLELMEEMLNYSYPGWYKITRRALLNE